MATCSKCKIESKIYRLVGREVTCYDCLIGNMKSLEVFEEGDIVVYNRDAAIIYKVNYERGKISSYTIFYISDSGYEQKHQVPINSVTRADIDRIEFDNLVKKKAHYYNYDSKTHHEKLTIEYSALDLIRKQILEGSNDKERCGLIIGTKKRGYWNKLNIVEIDNVSKTPEVHFKFDAKNFFNIVSKVLPLRKKSSLEIYARWHTHVIGLDEPSQLDKDMATSLHLDIIYCIPKDKFCAYTKKPFKEVIDIPI